MTIRTREIYRSAPNGDRWLLAHDPDAGRVFVRHEPNLPSGGQVADIEIGAFLIAAGSGPEKRELLPPNRDIGLAPQSLLPRRASRLAIDQDGSCGAMSSNESCIRADRSV